MTAPRILHADVSELVQMCLSGQEDMGLIQQQAVIWTYAGYDHVGDLESLADAAGEATGAVLAELRRIAGEIQP